MHLLQCNQDILHDVCIMLAPSLSDREVEAKRARADLRSVMLTCNAFNNGAWKILWRTLPGMHPLLHVLGYHNLPSYVRRNG